MLSIVICDDEEFYIEQIKKGVEDCLHQRYIRDYRIDVFDSGEALCSNLEQLKEYQIAFLDVNMEQMSGLDAAQKIREVNKEVYLAFITAYVDYAVEGYKVDAIRYLIKDSLSKTLPECMDTILDKMAYKQKKEVFQFIDGTREIPVRRICFVESKKHNLIFHIKNQEMETRIMYGKMSDIEDILLPHGFMRIHKSYLVNIKEINKMVNYKAELKMGESLPIPRDKYRQVKEAYFHMLGEV